MCSRHFHSEFTALLKDSPCLVHKLPQTPDVHSFTHTVVWLHRVGDDKLPVLDESS